LLVESLSEKAAGGDLGQLFIGGALFVQGLAEQALGLRQG
jgi:hypothetical protein